MLRRLGNDIWVAERPQRFYGLEVGTRMTVLRLADGSLLLHSPIALDAGVRSALEAPEASRASWPPGTPGSGSSPVPLPLPSCQPINRSYRS